MDYEDREILDWMLARYTRATRRKKELQDRLHDLNEEKKNPIKAIGYDPMPHGSGEGDGAAGILFKISDVEEKLLDQKREIADSLVAITEILDILPTKSEEREVCELRYLDRKSWEEIADILHFSTKQCQRKKNAALDYLLENEWVQIRIRDEAPHYEQCVAIADLRREKRRWQEELRNSEADE